MAEPKGEVVEDDGWNTVSTTGKNIKAKRVRGKKDDAVETP